jgi:hypothetical protein
MNFSEILEILIIFWPIALKKQGIDDRIVFFKTLFQELPPKKSLLLSLAKFSLKTGIELYKGQEQ